MDPYVDSLNVSGVDIKKVNMDQDFNKFDLIIMHTPHTIFEEIDFDEINTLIFDTTGNDFINNSERI